MASVRVRFSPELLLEAGFPGELVLHGFFVAPAEIKTTLEQPHFTSRRHGAPESSSSVVLEPS
jgi:hypothetical protein